MSGPVPARATGARLAAVVATRLAGRSLALIPRIPSTFVPSLVMPIFFTLAFAGAFSAIVALPGFPTDNIRSWVVPMTVLQGAAFAGVTTGMGVATDLESGFYDRLLLTPASRSVLMLGPLLAALFRAAIPFALVLVVGGLGGIVVPAGLAGLAVLFLVAMLMAVVAAAWSLGLVYRIKSSSAAPLMQVGLFVGFFLSTAQVPVAAMDGWLEAVAEVNPMTDVLAAARQGFLGEVTWAGSWPGILTLLVATGALGLWSQRALRRL